MLWLDTETYSETPIKQGTYKYAENAEVMLVTYAIDKGPVYCLDVAAAFIPDDLEEYLEGDGLITAHNSMFDRNVLRRAGYDLAIPRWRDTMVQALAHALPGGLSDLSALFGLGTASKKEGSKYIQRFCKPFGGVRSTRMTHPDEWAGFVEYAKQDIVAMRTLAGKLPTWNWGPEEIAAWHLDQEINDRGMNIDLELAEAMMAAVAIRQAGLRVEVEEITDGEVKSATKRDDMLEHILSMYGISLPDMTKATVERRIADPNIPEQLKELLRMRLQTATSSTAKYKALVNGVNTDGRLRGTIQFNGASRTRRASGRVFQPQNLPSRGLLPKADITLAIEAAKAGVLDLFLPNVMHAASSAVRGCIIPSPGHKLVVADLANIEGRVAAWLAGEEWKLQAFRDFDTVLGFDAKGKPIRGGPDLYKLAYARSFRKGVDDVTDAERSVGKVMELMLQYAGGVGAFVTGAASYSVDLEDMADKAFDALPENLIIEAEGFLTWMEKKDKKFSSQKAFGLSRHAFLVCDVFKRAWRTANFQISSYWKEIEETARNAIASPGKAVSCRALTMLRQGAWLTVQLPSGRYLCYPAPRVSDEGEISYMGTDQYTRKWERITTFGGKFLENATQSLSRDVLYGSFAPVEAAGYKVILHVHDELVTEVPIDSGLGVEGLGVEGLCQIMTAAQPWSTGLPLAAAGFEAMRYGKG